VRAYISDAMSLRLSCGCRSIFKLMNGEKMEFDVVSLIGGIICGVLGTLAALLVMKMGKK